MRHRYASDVRKQAFEILYGAGWSDRRIAAALQTRGPIIKGWRDARALPRNRPLEAKIDPERARELHAAGASDGAIARTFGVTQSGATRWRAQAGLPPNFIVKRPDAARTRQIAKHLRLGGTASQAAAAAGVSKTTALNIRRRLEPSPHLRPTGVSDRMVRAQVLRNDGLVGRIAKAVGQGLPDEVREDACADLYLAVLAGEVAIELIEQQAPHFRSRAWKMGGSAFEQRSIFDPIGEDGLCLGDLIEDAGAVERMENEVEMALAWR